MKNLKEKFVPAFNGLFDLIKSESSVRLQIFIGTLAIIGGLIVGFTYFEMLIVMVLVFLVISLECCNTVIEWLVDSKFTTYNDTARRIKDGAAAMVLVASIGSLIIGSYIFITHILGG